MFAHLLFLFTVSAHYPFGIVFKKIATKLEFTCKSIFVMFLDICSGSYSSLQNDGWNKSQY